MRWPVNAQMDNAVSPDASPQPAVPRAARPLSSPMSDVDNEAAPELGDPAVEHDPELARRLLWSVRVMDGDTAICRAGVARESALMRRSSDADHPPVSGVGPGRAR